MADPAEHPPGGQRRLGVISKAILWLGLGLAGLPFHAGAASVTNNASADASLMEIEPSHNNGGQEFFIAGHLQNPYRARGLLQFDFTALPTNTLIQSIVLELTVTRQPGDGLANSSFGLHRLLRPWGEGNKVAIDQPGQGLAATAGEATWSHSFYPTNAWTEPGGAADVDFVAAESSFQDIQGAGESYRFPATPELVEDVQRWVNDPSSNFGWMLVSNAEETPFTARLFGSREHPDAHPKLEVDYLVPPRIESSGRAGNQFALTFTAWPGQSYAVEFRDSLSPGTWQTLTNIGPITNATQILVTDTLAPQQRLYRVVGF